MFGPSLAILLQGSVQANGTGGRCHTHTYKAAFLRMVDVLESAMSASSRERPTWEEGEEDRPEPLVTSTPLLGKGEASNILGPDAIEQVRLRLLQGWAARDADGP